jgi:hypothetical protein
MQRPMRIDVTARRTGLWSASSTQVHSPKSFRSP